MPFEIKKQLLPYVHFRFFESPENIFHPAIFFPAGMMASYLPLHNSTARAGKFS